MQSLPPAPSTVRICDADQAILDRLGIRAIRRVGSKWIVEFTNGGARPASNLEVALLREVP